MAPYNHLRFMGALGMNSYSWLCGGDNAYGCSVIEWEDRVLPSYALKGEAALDVKSTCSLKVERCRRYSALSGLRWGRSMVCLLEITVA